MPVTVKKTAPTEPPATSTDDRLTRIEAAIEQLRLPTQRFLTREQTCEYMNISTYVLWRLEKASALKRIQVGGKILYDRQDVDAYMAAQKA
jgi:excisionase family DNA binding protein